MGQNEVLQYLEKNKGNPVDSREISKATSTGLSSVVTSLLKLRKNKLVVKIVKFNKVNRRPLWLYRVATNAETEKGLKLNCDEIVETKDGKFFKDKKNIKTRGKKQWK